MLFSILVANYNNSRFLKECLDSVIEQSYSNFEVIFVDDNSTDNSVEIYTQYKIIDDRFKLFINPQNMGCGYTKKRAIDCASGIICGFLDPDDKLENDALEKMTMYHMDNAKVGLISSRHYNCNDRMHVYGVSPIIIQDINFVNYLLSPTLSHFNTFKRHVYYQSCGLSVSTLRGVDQELCLVMEEVSNVIFVKDILYFYRHHRKGISSNGINEKKAKLWNLYIRFEACKRRQLPIDILTFYFNHNKYISLFIASIRCFRNIINNILSFFSIFRNK
ncbi:MAG: glycosyltransferase family 2 protein [Candidatus Thermoplasmatota archaeon]|nr:glycosyltransferase family 2 protein [Candidatus Thermoplasmatota archaeon]